MTLACSEQERSSLSEKLRESDHSRSVLQADLEQRQGEADQLEELRQQHQEDAERIQEMEEQLQQQSEEMEETDDRCASALPVCPRPCLELKFGSAADLTALKDVKRLQEAYERMQVRCETLAREVKLLEEFRSTALRRQLAEDEAGACTPPQSRQQRVRPAAQPSSGGSSGKKRSLPEEFEQSSSAPAVRAIAVSTASTSPRNAVQRPQKALASKPKSANVTSSAAASNGSSSSKKTPMDLKLHKKAAPLGSVPVNEPGKEEVGATKGGGGSQSGKLRASLAALRQPQPQQQAPPRLG